MPVDGPRMVVSGVTASAAFDAASRGYDQIACRLGSLMNTRSCSASTTTLYALIRRAEADGLIVETDERPDISLDDERRRYYRLTSLGRKVAAAEIDRLEAIVEMAREKKLVPRPRSL